MMLKAGITIWISRFRLKLFRGSKCFTVPVRPCMEPMPWEER